MFQKLLIVFVLLKIVLCANTTVGGEPPQALIDSIFIRPKSNVDEIINDLFQNRTSTEVPHTTNGVTLLPQAEVILPPGVPQVDNCPGGECVPHYLCLNNTFITDGETLIDIRFGEDKPLQCRDYLSVCCGSDDQLDEPIKPPPPTNPPEECGYRNPAGLGFRIHGKDSEAQYAEFPWMVALLREEMNEGKVLSVYHCGGSLIHAEVILTAAHCVHNKEPALLKIRAGEWDTQTINEVWAHQDRGAKKIIIHPQFNKATLFNDIALVMVNAPFEIIDNVQTICLPPPSYNFDESNRCAASGWGKNEFGREGSYQVILKKIELPIVPVPKCQASLRKTRLGRRFNLHPSFICAGGEAGKDTCKGDGGSPLVCPIPDTEQGRYYQSGIVAWGIGCGENQVPGVYVNVAMFRNWIDLEMQAKHLNSSSYIPIL